MKNDRYIMIVEDSKTQTKQIESILRQLGYRIEIAYNGKDALASIGKKRPMLVVSDILMPEMDGYELCKLIKHGEKWKDIPVVLLTQLSDPKEIVKGLECGADDFIVKPYTEELLLTRIKAVLSVRLKQDMASKDVHALVVEDSPTQAEQLKYLLEGYGYSVTVAANGKEALEAARRAKPTIIISDILMPVMDGYELADKVKHDEGLKDIPIILVTTLKDRKDVALRASVFADDFFTKPYDDSYLLEKIEALISSSKTGAPKKETERLEVTFSGERFHITASRRQILTFLLSTYENAVQQNRDLIQMQRELQMVNEQLEDLIMERTEQLHTSEAKYRTLIETSSDAMLVFGKDHALHFANKASEYLLGKEKQKIAERLSEFSVSAGERKDVEITRPDGEKLIVEMQVLPAKWGDKDAYLATLRDVTEKKMHEKELVRASKLESLGILAGGIAHDFNNLLTGVIGNASLAKSRIKKDDPVNKILIDMEKAAMRAKGLTQQLLTFAKGGTPVKKTAAIKKLLRESASFALTGSNVRCNFDIRADLRPVDIDEGQISQVLHNLMINAEQAMPNGGDIDLSAENCVISKDDHLPVKEGPYVKITVRDRGVGIPEKNLAKIFDPYFTTKDDGSGLGLATVYSIIKNHDGYVTAASETGAGASFFIFLPASEKTVRAKEASDDRAVRGSGRILIMDDEEIVRDVAQTILTDLGYDVELAEDGALAVRMYKDAMKAGRRYDAVIMDLTVPGGMGGKEAVKKILEFDPKVKALVSSGYSDAPVMSEFKRYGFSAVIAKPYRVGELSRAIELVLKGPGR